MESDSAPVSHCLLWIFVVVSRVRSIFRVTTTNQEVARSSRAGRTISTTYSDAFPCQNRL